MIRSLLFCHYPSNGASFLTLFRGVLLFVAILQMVLKFLDAILRGATFLSLFFKWCYFPDAIRRGATFLSLFFKWCYFLDAILRGTTLLSLFLIFCDVATFLASILRMGAVLS